MTIIDKASNALHNSLSQLNNSIENYNLGNDADAIRQAIEAKRLTNLFLIIMRQKHKNR